MRTESIINANWRFVRADNLQKTQRVSLPHTVGLTPANASGGRNYQGKAWYTRALSIPKSREGQRVIVELGAAMGYSRMSINGTDVAEHYCGYTPFVADITSFVSFGGANEISVEVDNSDNAELPPGKAQDMLDFSYEGGLYRTAKLLFLPAVHITHSLIENEIAGGGVFVWVEGITDATATVCIKAHVRNTTDEEQDFSINFSVLDAHKKIATFKSAMSLSANSAEHTTAQLTIACPKLWSIETPNLYTAQISIASNGKKQDELNISFGVRSFSFTYEHNFMLNNCSRRLSGGNYHQSYPYIGNAVPANLLRRDARKMRSLGLENVRSHYPFADEFVDECNRIGLSMLVANPGWQLYNNGIFAERLLDNMRSIVRWQRNNPCIVLWEPMPNESVVPQEFQQLLHDVVHEEYPHPSCYTASDHGPTDVSYRMYDPGMLEPGMEGYNPIKRYGTKSDFPVWIREYNDAPDNWTDQNCAWRTPRSWGDTPQLRAVQRMLGQDSQCAGNNYIDVYNNKLICGYGVWPAMEHNRGYHVNPCWGGFFDLFRIPKFTALFMQSQQDIATAGCVLHIANWWTDISPWDVTVFSNADCVRLYHNDVLVEERSPEDISVKRPPFIFKDVHNRFKARDRSVLRAEGIVDGEVVATVQIKTPGTPTHLHLFADIEGVAPVLGDIIVLRCSVLDDTDGIVPYSADNHPIVFEVEGGELIGDASIGANPICPQAGIAPALVRIISANVRVTARLQWEQHNARAAIKPAALEIYPLSK